MMENERNWADIQHDLFDLILQKLSFPDRFKIQGVCKTWRSNAKTHILSLLRTIRSQPPLLMLPNDEISEDMHGLCLVDILENKLFRKNKDLPRKIDSGFIGSSKGWLVSMNEEDERVYLFNPFLDVGLRTNLPGLSKMDKIVLWSNPILSDDNNYGIVTLDEHRFDSSRVAYAKRGDINWSNLNNCAQTSYCDIVCCNHLVYALSERCWVEAWDFRPIIPAKSMEIPAHFAQESIIEFGNFHEDLYRSQFYLIVSNGELLLVRRYIGYHVRNDGLVVSEADIEDYEQDGYSFRYLTKFFYIFKLDFGREEWVKVEDLGDGVILLGGNESVLVQSGDFMEFEKNSIYFTDDSWDDIDIYCDYGSHDNGIYRLKDNSIELLSHSWKIRTPPFWVIPGSM